MSKAAEILLKRGRRTLCAGIQSQSKGQRTLRELVQGPGSATEAREAFGGARYSGLPQLDIAVRPQKNTPSVVQCGTCGVMRFSGTALSPANAVACGLPNCPFGGSTTEVKPRYEEVGLMVPESAKIVMRFVGKQQAKAGMAR